jgi:small subunit ribosomal protein S17
MGDKEKMEDKSKTTKKAPIKTVAKKAPIKTVAKKAPIKTVAKKAPIKTVAKKAPIKVAPVTEAAKKIVRTVTGKVTSNKMDKTITVLVERKVKHPLYGKYINQSNKFHAHDEKNEINEGDVVQITEHKPISKSKSWVVTKVVSKARIET